MLLPCALLGNGSIEVLVLAEYLPPLDEVKHEHD